MATDSAGRGPRTGRGSGSGRVALIGLAGVLVALALYIYGRVHTPNYLMGLFGNYGLQAIMLKSLLATIVLGLAVVQVALALWIYQKLPLAGRAPKPVRMTHRIVGIGLFALSLPIAIHCIIAYGVELTSARVVVHAVAGCFFYGAFVAKVLLVHSRRLPGWALPVAGGILAVLVVVLWYTSALWYYNGYSLPG
jgi:Family of unknown function (DUF6529)